MVDYVEKGGVYNFEEQDPDLVSWGLAGRAQTWNQAMIAAERLTEDPPLPSLKLKVWRNPYLVDWQWCLKWVPKEQP